MKKIITKKARKFLSNSYCKTVEYEKSKLGKIEDDPIFELVDDNLRK